MRVSNPVPHQRKAVRGIYPAVEGNRIRAPCCLLLAQLKEKMKGQLNIGVISDTHGQVRSEVYNAFEGVDFILHAGDIGSRDVVTELEVIAPVKAVVGNIDVDLTHHFPQQQTFDLGKRTFVLQHIFHDIPSAASLSRQSVRKIIIFGHSHRPMGEHIGDTLYFNPGSAGPRRLQLPICVGKLKLEEERVSGEIIHLE